MWHIIKRIVNDTKITTKQIRYFTATTKDNNNFKDDSYNPIKRTFDILKNDVQKFTNLFKSNESSTTSTPDEIATQNYGNKLDGIFPSHCDVLIIGGGGVGSSVAYWLKEKARNGLNVVVVERDPTYQKASTVLSVGGLRHQFSLPENIEMSLFGADFMRDIKRYLGDVELNFTPYGYLVLASEAGAEILRRNSKVQNELGACNELLTAKQLKRKFPWISTEGVALGCHGLEREGWFDPWALLMGFKKKAQEYGAHFLNAEVTGFTYRPLSDVVTQAGPDNEFVGLDKAIVKMPDGQEKTIQFSLCVLAAGAYSGEVGRMARIGLGKGLLAIPLPVEPRKRYVYVINTQGENAPGLCTPLTIDPNGTYFRRDGLGGNYLCGRSPTNEQEPTTDNLDVDYEFFVNEVWPTLAKRCKAFESAKVVNSWAGYYEYNVFDENGIIGVHPFYSNLMIATGFSGHGIQQTPAVGRAISEIILDGRYRTIDLTRLGFDRILVDRPMLESNIY